MRPTKATPSPLDESDAALPAIVCPHDLTPNHFKLLYLISIYAIAANSTKQNERWIRHVPLLVLMFEGIRSGAFDFDYAPASVRLSFRGRTLRRWMNISREGKAAILDLWDLRLVNGIKLSSDDFQPITAYQVSSKGLHALRLLPMCYRDDVDKFTYPPATHEKRLLQVSYDGSRFLLKSSVFTKASAITESEDVSYVSSPYLPSCLRAYGAPRLDMRSNRHRAEESATGVNGICTRTSEDVTLGYVSALVGEWVPFGSNQIVALNERMGALDRCQGGILTSFMDSDPTVAEFAVPIGQTQVRILDYDFVRFINFEAESHFPEHSGIVQVEHFGMHLNSDGSLIYGIRVEAILDRRADDLAVDHLARLLVDVHQDSSMLVNDLLSRYQVSLLEMLYLGDSFQRNKYNCILATQIRPKLPAREYLTTPRYANELAQVLGDLHACHDLSSEDILLVGKNGCLISGPHVSRFENLLTKYVGLVCRDMFMKNFFARTFMLDAMLKEIRALVQVMPRDPAVGFQVRDKLALVSKDTILLAETLEYLLDSLEDLELTTSLGHGARDSFTVSRSQSDAEVEATLMRVLALQQLKTQTILRCHDSIKLMENTMQQLEQLQMIAEATATTQLEVACRRVHLNTRELIHATTHQHHTRLTLEALQYIIGGLFIFDVIDRLLGGTFNVHLPRWAVDWVVEPLLSHALLWWGVNMFIFALCLAVMRLITRVVVGRHPLGWCTVHAEINRRISVGQLEAMLLRKRKRRVAATHVAPTSDSSSSRLRVVVWQEGPEGPGARQRWLNAAPRIELCYDEKHGFLLFAALRFDSKRTPLREEECLAALHDLLEENGVFMTAMGTPSPTTSASVVMPDAGSSAGTAAAATTTATTITTTTSVPRKDTK